MKNNWFCPNCGQPMEAQRHVDNPTGRITWTIAASTRNTSTRAAT